MQVSTLRALELKAGQDGQLQLQGRLRYLPGPVQDVILFCRWGVVHWDACNFLSKRLVFSHLSTARSSCSLQPDVLPG